MSCLLVFGCSQWKLQLKWRFFISFCCNGCRWYTKGALQSHIHNDREGFVQSTIHQWVWMKYIYIYIYNLNIKCLNWKYQKVSTNWITKLLKMNWAGLIWRLIRFWMLPVFDAWPFSVRGSSFVFLWVFFFFLLNMELMGWSFFNLFNSNVSMLMGWS